MAMEVANRASVSQFCKAHFYMMDLFLMGLDSLAPTEDCHVKYYICETRAREGGGRAVVMIEL